MTSRQKPLGKLSVVVDGDVTVDWHLAQREDRREQAICASSRGGGAALLGDLVEEVAKRLPKRRFSAVEVETPGQPQPNGPTDPGFHHRFALWRSFEEKEARKTQAWRVEKSLGTQRAADGEGRLKRSAGSASAQSDLVVLHDAGLGFRDDPRRWPAAIGTESERGPWVLLRMARPVAKGALWEALEPIAKRTIVIIHIDDLRLGAVHVTRELSWERTAQDLLWELLYNQQVNPLRQCAHVVVSFTTAGALVLSDGGDEKRRRCRLVFDPALMERMWNETHQGEMIGGVTALTASVARELMLPSRSGPDLIRGVQRGIAAMRTLDLEGYEEEKQDRGGDRVRYPTERIARALSSGPREFAEARVCDPARLRPPKGSQRKGQEWTILKDRHRKEREIQELATRIVEEGGKNALPNVPRGEFRKLTTFDRSEIEGLQSIRTLIRQYDKRERPSEPLSIAVFGPPGAGKSWSVNQVAKAVLGNRIEPITFNLSQFDDPRELIDAMYQVRDISIAGKLPLVLWDEFDSTRVAGGNRQKLGWLSHFLSPMADGKFQDGQLTHSIGRAVFVFAGGIFQRMEEFVEKSHQHKNAKAPDFVSRLSGYVNVSGPNPHDDDAKADPHYLIRRAVMVRSLLEQHWDAVFEEHDGVRKPNVDEGVLRALLFTKKYEHGARSLTSIITTSAVPERNHFERSDLPSESELGLYVDVRDFLDLVHFPPIEGELLEHLAEAVHKSHGVKDTSDGKPVPYADLPESVKQARRDEARELPKELAAIGFNVSTMSTERAADDLIDLRSTLEAAAVERAAADGADQAELEKAQAALDKMRRSWSEPDKFHEADASFHVALAGASGSEAMRLVMSGVRDAIAERLKEPVSGDGDSEGTLRRRAREHGNILRAVKRHEGERAERLIRAHLDRFRGERSLAETKSQRLHKA